MIKISQLVQVLENWAPLSWAEDYDNVGLLCGHMDAEISAALLCLDVTLEVIDEAIAKNVGLIVAHHPILFKSIKRIDLSLNLGEILQKALQNNIAIYAFHTNFDSAPNAMNASFAEKLNISDIAFLHTKNHEDIHGSGAFGWLQNPIDPLTFLCLLKEKFDLKMLRHTALGNKKIQKIAFCGGSGSFLIPAAIAQKADAFVSADFKYHDFFLPENRLLLVDIGHFESEIHGVDKIFMYVKEKNLNFELLITKVNTNPVNYF